MKRIALLVSLLACWTCDSHAEPVVLHFDVPAPCSEAWAKRGGSAIEAKTFGKACLSRSANHPKMTREAVFALALDIVRADDRLSPLLPTDIATFCPRYAQLDTSGRQVFWAGLLTAIARPESNYDPMDVLWEGPRDPEYSIGLLQISPSNRAGYRCAFGSEAELTDPRANLACGVRIIAALVGHAGMVGGGSPATGRVGAAHYWSTLRAVAYKPDRVSGRLAADTRREIADAASAAPGCR